MSLDSVAAGPDLVLKYGVTNISGVPSIAMDIMEAFATPGKLFEHFMSLDTYKRDNRARKVKAEAQIRSYRNWGSGCSK